MITHNDFIKIQSVLQRSRDIFLKHPVVLFQCLIGPTGRRFLILNLGIAHAHTVRLISLVARVLVLLGGFPFFV